MYKIKYLLILFALTFTKGCKICDRILNLKSIIENKSSREIKIYFYHNGIKNNEFLVLKRNDRIENLYFRCDKRIFNKDISPQVIETFGGSGEYGSRFPIDSIAVIYESKKEKIHIAFSKNSKNPLSINIDEERNLFNLENYSFMKIVDEKCSFEGEAIYTFSEQDYLEAKNL